jgi:hypothetical protein
MLQWQFRAVMAFCFLLSLLPFALCLPLWKPSQKETHGAWRRVMSRIGLGLATVASLVPPLWLFSMQLLSRTKDNDESPMLGVMIDAVFVGMACAIFGAIALCFAKGRVRWMGITACAVTIALFLLSFVAASPSLMR